MNKNVVMILGIDPTYWEQRVAKREPMPLLVAVLFRAIADFLEEPKPPQDYRQARLRAREVEEYRQSAFRWIFSNDESEFNFKTMCTACGCDPAAARERLLRIRLNGHIGALPTPDKKKRKYFRH